MRLPDLNSIIAAVMVAAAGYYCVEMFLGTNRGASRPHARSFFLAGLLLYLATLIYLAVQLRLFPYPEKSNLVADALFVLICPVAGGLLVVWGIWLFEKRKRELK